MPLRMVTSPTGLPSKRCQGIGFLSRADWEIGVVRHVAQPTGSSRISSGGRPHPELCRESREPLQTKQGNRHSCRDQEGRRGSEEVVPGPSVFPLREPGLSGNFWVSREGCQVLFRTSGWNMGLPLRPRSGPRPHLSIWGNHVVFLELRRDSRVMTGISGFLLCWPWEAQSSMRVARESWGLHSSHCRAEETSPRRVSGT